MCGSPLPPASLWVLLHAPLSQVLIEHRRSSSARNLLNSQELVELCNAEGFRGSGGEWQLDPASPIKRVQCR